MKDAWPLFIRLQEHYWVTLRAYRGDYLCRVSCRETGVSKLVASFSATSAAGAIYGAHRKLSEKHHEVREK